MPALAASQNTAVYKQINYAGGTLFAIALKYLNDPTQWDRIAALNGLSDPWLLGTGSLLIPPANPSASGLVVIPPQG